MVNANPSIEIRMVGQHQLHLHNILHHLQRPRLDGTTILCTHCTPFRPLIILFGLFRHDEDGSGTEPALEVDGERVEGVWRSQCDLDPVWRGFGKR